MFYIIETLFANCHMLAFFSIHRTRTAGIIWGQLVGTPTGPYPFEPAAHWLMLWLLQLGVISIGAKFWITSNMSKIRIWIDDFFILGWCPRPQGHGVLFRFLIGPLFMAPQIFKSFQQKIWSAHFFVLMLLFSVTPKIPLYAAIWPYS